MACATHSGTNLILQLACLYEQACLQDALLAPLRDPMHALTPIAPSRALRSDMPSRLDRSCAPADQTGPVPEYVAQMVLQHRTFRMLTPHTILKAPHESGLQRTRSSGGTGGVEGDSELLRVTGLPIWLATNPSLQVLAWSPPAMISLLKTAANVCVCDCILVATSV